MSLAGPHGGSGAGDSQEKLWSPFCSSSSPAAVRKPPFSSSPLIRGCFAQGRGCGAVAEPHGRWSRVLLRDACGAARGCAVPPAWAGTRVPCRTGPHRRGDRWERCSLCAWGLGGTTRHWGPWPRVGREPVPGVPGGCTGNGGVPPWGSHRGHPTVGIPVPRAGFRHSPASAPTGGCSWAPELLHATI